MLPLFFISCQRVSRSREQSKIVWLISRFPFDIAAKARLLFDRDRFSGQQQVHRHSQIAACYLYLAMRTRVVKLAAVDQPVCRIK